MFIPDHGSKFFHPVSRIQGQKDSGSRIQIRIKEFQYFLPKQLFISSQKYDPGCSSRIRIPDPDLDFTPILDPGSSSQKGTGSRIRNTSLYSLTWILSPVSTPRCKAGTLASPHPACPSHPWPPGSTPSTENKREHNYQLQ
jgi:hypothetical protein